ncbi:MAG: hypothetical protein K8T10_04615 [Candidatus Eremiobacteraeota bacterium]|nr:hypothetical protein [Candidatus Eremiobacteraeota bacterium]
MNILDSIKHRLSKGNKIPVGHNDEAGETVAQNNIEDKVSLSSGSGDKNDSMSLKDVATAGGVGLSLGIGMGNSGKIENLEKEIRDMKSGKALYYVPSWSEGNEPEMTPREMKALKMISKNAFLKGVKNPDNSNNGVALVLAGIIGVYASMTMIPIGTVGLAAFATFMGIPVLGMTLVQTVACLASGKNKANQEKTKWAKTFSDKTEAESMAEFKDNNPEIWMNIMMKR